MSARTRSRLAAAATTIALPALMFASPGHAAPSEPSDQVTAATVNAKLTAAAKATEAMNTANEDSEALRDQMSELAASITGLQVQYTRERDLVAQGVVEQQMTAPLGATTQLLASDDTAAFIDGLHARRLVADAQTERLDDLLVSGHELEQQQKRLADKRALVAQRRAAAARHLKDAKRAYRAAKADLAQLNQAARATVDAPAVSPDQVPKVLAKGNAKTVLTFALAQLGDPYQWGGTGPDGWDCSGLVQQSYAAAGVSVPRVVSPQYDASTHIAMSDLRPGDLVFYADMSHVGIFLGNGQVVHAPRPGRNVEITTTARFTKAGRVLG